MSARHGPDLGVRLVWLVSPRTQDSVDWIEARLSDSGWTLTSAGILIRDSHFERLVRAAREAGFSLDYSADW